MDHNLKHEIYRKALHLSSLWMPVFIYYVPQIWSVVFFGVGLAVNLLTEYLNYKRQPLVSGVYRRFFHKLLRGKEGNRKKFIPSGSVYVLAGAFISTLCFSSSIAATGMAVMLISDSAAALIGKRFGRLKIYKQKSWAGTAAFFFSALGVVVLLHNFGPAAVIACLAATLAELFEDKIKIDDNLSIPLIIGLILNFL